MAGAVGSRMSSSSIDHVVATDGVCNALVACITLDMGRVDWIKRLVPWLSRPLGHANSPQCLPAYWICIILLKYYYAFLRLQGNPRTAQPQSNCSSFVFILLFDASKAINFRFVLIYSNKTFRREFYLHRFNYLLQLQSLLPKQRSESPQKRYGSPHFWVEHKCRRPPAWLEGRTTGENCNLRIREHRCNRTPASRLQTHFLNNKEFPHLPACSFNEQRTNASKVQLYLVHIQN